MNWQPMETLPRDGRTFDLYHKNDFRVVDCAIDPNDGKLLGGIGFPLGDFVAWMPVPPPPRMVAAPNGVDLNEAIRDQGRFNRLIDHSHIDFRVESDGAEVLTINFSRGFHGKGLGKMRSLNDRIAFVLDQLK